MQRSKQILLQEAHKKTAIKQNPRWHISLPPVQRLFSGGDICCSGVMRLEQRVWLFLDIFTTPVPRVHWVGISNFITCHKRDTGCSGEHCSLPSPPRPSLPTTPPLARHHTRPWKLCLEREDEDFPSGRQQPLASRRPYCLPAPNWFEGWEIISIM